MPFAAHLDWAACPSRLYFSASPADDACGQSMVEAKRVANGIHLLPDQKAIRGTNFERLQCFLLRKHTLVTALGPIAQGYFSWKLCQNDSCSNDSATRIINFLHLWRHKASSISCSDCRCTRVVMYLRLPVEKLHAQQAVD